MAVETRLLTIHNYLRYLEFIKHASVEKTRNYPRTASPGGPRPYLPRDTTNCYQHTQKLARRGKRLYKTNVLHTEHPNSHKTPQRYPTPRLQTIQLPVFTIRHVKYARTPENCGLKEISTQHPEGSLMRLKTILINPRTVEGKNGPTSTPRDIFFNHPTHILPLKARPTLNATFRLPSKPPLPRLR